ncbi:effector-associated constant component EACC1 [Glycomyces tenuis]|uniref:effector-associated constant component EACC1 n=1 Tax=Glycomyces tenuis TaxID=58116 RepID=UPI000415DBA8|nr:hypothetical protein [Glycomyces tenuis]
MPEIRIEVDGQPGDTADLFEELRSARIHPGVEIKAVSNRDGTLGPFDAVLAVVNSLAAVGSLVVAVLQWKTPSGPKVRIELGEGKSIVIENADADTVERIWKLIEPPEEDDLR